MIVLDESCLKRHRGPGLCLRCGRWTARREAHHAFVKRGVGGGSRLDLDPNMAALCRECHHKCEHSHAVNAEVQEKVARRERGRHGASATADAIQEWLWLVLRTAKAGVLPPPPWGLRNAANDTTPGDGDVRPGPVHRPGRRQGPEGVLRQPDLGPPGHPGPGLAADADGWGEL